MRQTTTTGPLQSGLHDATSVPEALLPIRKVLAIRGIGRSRHYEDVAAGLYPPPVKLSSRCARWPVGEVLVMVRAAIAGRPEAEIKELVRRLESARTVSQAA